MKRFPLLIGIIVTLLVSMAFQYSSAENAPSYVLQWGSQGLQTTGLFSFPQNLDVDSSGNVYVSDYGNRRIQEFDNTGNFLHTWGSKGSNNGQFQVPAGIAIHGDYVYVVDNDLNRVQKFDKIGKYVTQWGSKGNADGKFMLPQGIAVDSSGDVYVVDTGNSRIQKFDADGKFLLSWGSSGLENGQFLNPRGVATDPQGSVYVSDSGNNRIQKFTADGVFIKIFDVSSGNSLKFPQGLDVDSSGNLYIADTGNNRIVKIDRDGNSLSSWGSQGQANGNFYNPKDVSLDSDGNIYVVDSSNHRIQKFSQQNIQSATKTNLAGQTNLKPSTNDKTNPIITAPSDIRVEANGLLSSVSIGQATATDSSGIASLVNNAPEKFPLGTTTVVWTATDGSGNVAKATQKVTVSDTTSPVIAAPPSITIEAGLDTETLELGDPSTSDVVGVVSVTNDAPSSFLLGDTIITWTATDAAGNSANSKQVVTVKDTTRPKIRAPTDVTAEATSLTENTVLLGDPVVTDNGEIQSITNDAPPVFPLGTTTVTWTAVDASGNTATDSQKIKIIDTTSPTIIAPLDIISEAVSKSDNLIQIGQANATDIQLVSVTNDAPSVFPLGETLVTWNATDPDGHSSIAVQKITVIDTTAPNIVLPDDVITEATSTDHNSVSTGQAFAQDVIGISSITNNAPLEFAFGNTTVTWTAVDTSGNSFSANQTISIVDTTPPQLEAPKDIIEEARDSVSNIVQLEQPIAIDVIGVASITNNAPEVFQIGLTTVTWTAVDTSGNEINAIQTVTIVDTTNPIIVTPSDVIVEATSLDENYVMLGNATASDITGIFSITNDAPSVFPVGDTIVTWTAVDAHGNSATATQKVSVIDTTSPSLVVPNDVVSEATSANSNTLSLGDAVAHDSVDSFPQITNDAPSVFPVGDTIVTWTAVDAHGNSATATQKVSVIDTTPPVIVVPEAIELEATSASENYVILGNATATDFVGIESITNDAPSLFKVGQTIVNWTATDLTGLTSTASQKVVIKDTTLPILKVPDEITVEAKSTSENLVNIGQASAFDAVGIESITNDAPETFPLGLTTITWAATDLSGLTYSATQKIKVVDTTSPEISVPEDVVAEAESPTLTPVIIAEATATDALGVVSITNNSPQSFHLGETLVTWTATDSSGNIVNATQKVTIVDTVAPVISPLQDIVIEASSASNNLVSLEEVTAEDNVGVVSITNDAPAIFPVGKTTVVWAVTDKAGNKVESTQNVIITDTTSPSILVPEDVSVEAVDPAQNIVDIGNANATDLVGVVSITNNAPNSFPFGKTVVTWTAIDAAGNSVTDTQTVNVVDTTSPKINAPDNVTAEASSLTSNLAQIGTATGKDVMGISTLTNDAPSTFPFGETIVTWTATDNSGNSASAIQKVTIIDTTGPKLIVPDEIVIDATAPSTPVIVGKATAHDIIDENPKITNDAPETFSLGETIVTWTATDQFGNSVNMTQKINVQACGKPVTSYNLITGRPTDDTLVGTDLADFIFGLAGNDIIIGNDGDDCIIGGEGDDIIFGNEGEDTISADNGNDIIRGGAGEDKINGNSGFDIIDGGDEHDSCNVGETSNDDVVTKCESGQL